MKRRWLIVAAVVVVVAIPVVLQIGKVAKRSGESRRLAASLRQHLKANNLPGVCDCALLPDSDSVLINMYGPLDDEEFHPLIREWISRRRSEGTFRGPATVRFT